MVKVKDIYNYIDQIAPFALQMDFDNAGLLVGDREAEVDRVLLALDATLDVAAEAGRKRCGLIVTHHPLIFHPLKAVTPDDPTQAVVARLVKKNTALICAHTNLDLAPGGVNDTLMEALGLKTTGILEPMGEHPAVGPYGLGRVGELPEAMEPKAFAVYVKKALGAKAVRAVAGTGAVKKVAVGAGACGDMTAQAVRAGADAYVTADAKHHEFLEAKALGVTFLDAGHYATENPVMPDLLTRLEEAFRGQGVEFLLSKRHKEPYFAP